MAEAAAVKKVNCDLCNSDIMVTWFCDECTQHLCDSCQFLHSKSTASRLHEVSLVTDANEEEPEEFKGSDFVECPVETETCLIHTGNMYDNFCDDCDKLVCQSCVQEEHDGHRVIEIDDAAARKMNTINKKIDMLQKYGVLKSRQKIASMQNTKDVYTKKVNEERNLIRERNEKLKDKIDDITEALLKELETKEDADLKFLSRTQRKLSETASNIQHTIEFCNKGIALKTDIPLIQCYAESCSQLDEMNLSTFESVDAKVHPPKFVHGSLEHEDLVQLFGQLEYVTRPLRRSIKRTSIAFPRSIKAHVQSTIVQKPRNGAFSIYSTGNGNAMIGTEAKTIEVVNTSGKVIANIKIDITPYNIACSYLGKDLYLSMRNMRIKKLMNGSFTTHTETSPFQPQGLCVNYDGELFVCLYHVEDAVGKVARYSPDGRCLQTFQYDKNGQLLFSNPTRVAVNVNKDICVVDAARKSVVVLTAEGNKRFTYTGSRGGKFEPKCVTCSIRGSILIGDHVDDRVHLLDKHGNFLQYILSTNDGLNEIIAISADASEKRIWISCFDKIVVATLD